MSYALIDNASITAVERVLGEITVKNPDTINGDLCAFENFIQAVLFYDELVSLDNYKNEFREKRIEKFEFINFLRPEDLNLHEIDELAKREAKLIKPEISGGEFADKDFKSLIDILKLNMVCTWDMRSSVYYLTMKMLGQPDTPEYEKYSALSAIIFNELSDIAETKGHWSTDVTLVSSNGEILKKEGKDAKISGFGGITRPLQMFIASLNWLAYKSIYYSLAAKHLEADSFIHPIRHAYQIHWMKKTGAFGHDFTSRLLENLSKKISTTASEIIDHGRTATVNLDLPIFSAWLTQEAGSINKVIKSALELKKEEHFLIARETIREIKIAYKEGGFKKGNSKVTKLVSDLEVISGDLKRKYGIRSQQGIQGSFLIQSINSIGSLAGFPAIPEIKFALSTPDFIKSRRVKAFTTIFKDITNELTSIERLGGLREKMAASFQVDEEYYSRPKTEDPRFRYKKSFWKIPM